MQSSNKVAESPTVINNHNINWNQWHNISHHDPIDIELISTIIDTIDTIPIFPWKYEYVILRGQHSGTIKVEKTTTSN
jgi:hypothetical protein